jgi:hypothetical protein
VVWESEGSSGTDSSSLSVQGQRYDSTGTPLGTEFQVNTYTPGQQEYPRVATDTSGNFVVVWTSDGSSGPDSSLSSIQGQRYDGTGAPLGTEFQVNAYTTDRQDFPSVATDAAGDLVLVWESSRSAGTDSSFSSIQGQRFTTAALCGTAPEPDSSCRLVDAAGAGKSSVQIRNASDNTNDSFTWKWNKGTATAVGDFKAPDTAAATYRLCVYDGSGGTEPLWEADIPNGGVRPLCGSNACWKVMTTGFKYANKATAPSGIKSVKFTAGDAGDAQVRIKGTGVLLAPPATGSLVTDIVVQLLIDDGATIECFKTSFPGPSGQGAVLEQTATRFRAKGP